MKIFNHHDIFNYAFRCMLKIIPGNIIQLRIVEYRVCAKCKLHKVIPEFTSLKKTCNTCVKEHRRFQYKLKKEEQERDPNYEINKEIALAKRRNQYQKSKGNPTSKPPSITARISNNIRSALDKKRKTLGFTGNYTEMLGCQQKFLLSWFEYNIKQDKLIGLSLNMSMENYGTVWNIDHVFPLSQVGKDDVNPKFYLSWENLRPMDKSLNRKKSNKIIIDDINLIKDRVIKFKQLMLASNTAG